MPLILSSPPFVCVVRFIPCVESALRAETRLALCANRLPVRCGTEAPVVVEVRAIVASEVRVVVRAGGLYDVREDLTKMRAVLM
jgi:hypothetical protein